MSNVPAGINPIAELTEVTGDIYQLGEYLSEHFDNDEYLIVSVVGGGIYIAEPGDEDAYWKVRTTVDDTPGSGDWFGGVDQASSQFPDDVKFVDLFGLGEALIIGVDD